MNSTATDLIGLEEAQRTWLRDPSGFVFARPISNTFMRRVDYPPPLEDKSQRTSSSRLLNPASWSQRRFSEEHFVLFLQEEADSINSKWKMPPQTPDRQLLTGLDLALTPHHYALIDNWWLFISLDNVLDAWAAVYEDPLGKIPGAFASLVLHKFFSRSRKATAAQETDFGQWLFRNCLFAIKIWGELYETLYAARRDQLLNLRQRADELGRPTTSNPKKRAAKEWEAFQTGVLEDLEKDRKGWTWAREKLRAPWKQLDPTMATILDFQRLADPPAWDEYVKELLAMDENRRKRFFPGPRGKSRANVFKDPDQV
ncbi:hypothetical protein JCM1840_003750 [Sporobolomyces johnsonii]